MVLTTYASKPQPKRMKDLEPKFLLLLIRPDNNIIFIFSLFIIYIVLDVVYTSSEAGKIILFLSGMYVNVWIKGQRSQGYTECIAVTFQDGSLSSVHLK